MPDILTVTANPALDIATTCERIEPNHKLRCSSAEYFPGGGGINVARVVQRLGGDCLAVYLAGGLVGDRLEQLLRAEAVPGNRLPIRGETRESFSVLEESSGREFRFVLPGPTVTRTEWDGCVDLLRTIAPAPRFVVLSGSLPPGVPEDAYAVLAAAARQRGCKVLLDSSGAALAAALDQGVYLVKPSLRELSELVGQALDDEAAWRQAAQELVQQNRAELVALSLGDKGALLASADGVWRADALPVKVRSTTGAGDSFLGAMAWALSRGMAPEQAFRHGLAGGTAALLQTGTALCQADALFERLQQVQLRPIT